MNEVESYVFQAHEERREYSELLPADINNYAEMVQDEIEFLFQNIRSGNGVATHFSTDEEMSIHRTSMNSKLPSTVAEDTVWLYEQGTGSILQYVPAEKDCNLHVELRHLQFRDNHPLAIEEYAVRVEKLVVGTLDPFVTFYQFVHQKGDVWRAEVERCSINPVPWRGEGPRYTRRMSSYDFDEFFKDMTIIEESHLSDEAKKNRFVIH